MRLLPYPRLITVSDTLDTLIDENYREKFKHEILELAFIGDVEIYGILVRLELTGYGQGEDPMEMQYDLERIAPGEVRAAEVDWEKNQLRFDALSLRQPEERRDHYIDVSFVRDQIITLLVGARPSEKRPERNNPGPTENSAWRELKKIAEQIARQGLDGNNEDFYDEIRDHAIYSNIWAPKSNTSFKNEKNGSFFIPLANKATGKA